MAGPGPNPIWAETVRKAFSADQQTADEHDASAEQAQLDKAELRELERSELYSGIATAIPRSRIRSMLDRLFRRSA